MSNPALTWRRASAAVIVLVKLRLLQLSKPTQTGVIWKPFLNVSLLRLILISSSSSSSQGRSGRWPGSAHASSSSHAKLCRRSQHLQAEHTVSTSWISLCVYSDGKAKSAAWVCEILRLLRIWKYRCWRYFGLHKFVQARHT